MAQNDLILIAVLRQTADQLESGRAKLEDQRIKVKNHIERYVDRDGNEQVMHTGSVLELNVKVRRMHV